jgi:hypothetical protein
MPDDTNTLTPQQQHSHPDIALPGGKRLVKSVRDILMIDVVPSPRRMRRHSVDTDEPSVSNDGLDVGCGQ